MKMQSVRHAFGAIQYHNAKQERAIENSSRSTAIWNEVIALEEQGYTIHLRYQKIPDFPGYHKVVTFTQNDSDHPVERIHLNPGPWGLWSPLSKCLLQALQDFRAKLANKFANEALLPLAFN